MSQLTGQTGHVQKNIEPMRQREQKVIQHAEHEGVPMVVPQAAYRRAQVNSNGLRATDLLALQRTVGNRMVQRLLMQGVACTNRQHQTATVEENPGIKVQAKLTTDDPHDLPLQKITSRTNDGAITRIQGLYAYVGNSPVTLLTLFGLQKAEGKSCPKGQRPCPKTNYTPPYNGCGPAGWKGKLVPNKPLWMIDFRDACNQHDRCYGTCNKSKEACDNEFLADMGSACYWRYARDILGIQWQPPSFEICTELARTYYKAVARFGADPYKDAQAEACDCCSVNDRDGALGS